jgi:hypothetical protein
VQQSWPGILSRCATKMKRLLWSSSTVTFRDFPTAVPGPIAGAGEVWKTTIYAFKKTVPRVHQIVSAVFQLGFVDLFCREYHLDGTVQALTIAKD